MINDVIKSIETSPIWENLNKQCKNIYEKNNRIPNEQEYRALRNMLICKTILEDKKVRDEMIEYIYNELNRR